MAITFMFPPSLGEATAAARGQQLAVELSKSLGRTVIIEIAPSYAELEKRIESGTVDLAWAPPTICAKLGHHARAVLKAVRSSGASYLAALICPVSAGLTVQTLTQKRVAWVDAQSTGGYLLPRAYLRSLGHDPDALFSSQRFFGSYRDAVLAVLAGDADVTSVYASAPDSMAVRASLSEMVGGLAERFVPIAYTGRSATDAIIVTTATRAELADKVVALFTGDPKSGDPALAVALEVCNAVRFVLAGRDDYRSA